MDYVLSLLLRSVLLLGSHDYQGPETDHQCLFSVLPPESRVTTPDPAFSFSLFRPCQS